MSCVAVSVIFSAAASLPHPRRALTQGCQCLDCTAAIPPPFILSTGASCPGTTYQVMDQGSCEDAGEYFEAQGGGKTKDVTERNRGGEPTGCYYRGTSLHKAGGSNAGDCAGFECVCGNSAAATSCSAYDTGSSTGYTMSKSYACPADTSAVGKAGCKDACVRLGLIKASDDVLSGKFGNPYPSNCYYKLAEGKCYNNEDAGCSGAACGNYNVMEQNRYAVCTYTDACKMHASACPSYQYPVPTASPSLSPSVAPTHPPSLSPVVLPTVAPTTPPIILPSVAPTTSAPSLPPSPSPSSSPT
eukprot:Hpha_TRINITY_DN26299_c0_g1::TRINITY_DN26299_c0_g1_i1::g.184615::m.184615